MPTTDPGYGDDPAGARQRRKLSADLFRTLIQPAFSNPALDKVDDQATLQIAGARLAFSTDSYVVKPIFFRGGDIGSLAVHGTVNDLAVGGARPLFLSAAFILEEGFPLDSLRRVVTSMSEAAAHAGVQIVTGDTKVVERGGCDGMFINTAGIGVIETKLQLSADQARAGDVVLLSGAIGDHGIAILAEREGLSFESDVSSDSAALHTLNGQPAGDRSCHSRDARSDARRVASSCNEIAQSSGVGIELAERSIPVHNTVRGACEMLGLDPAVHRERGQTAGHLRAGGCRPAACGNAGSSAGSRGRHHRQGNGAEQRAGDAAQLAEHRARGGSDDERSAAAYLLIKFRAGCAHWQ